jgi:hypothetical protein
MSFAAGRRAGSGDLVGAISVVRVIYGNVAAAAGERLCNRSTDASGRAGAGNNRDLSVEIHRLLSDETGRAFFEKGRNSLQIVLGRFEWPAQFVV